MSREDINPEDPLPALRAELDQMVMLMSEMARVASAWFESFKEEGFSETQALYLTAAQLVQSPGKAP